MVARPTLSSREMLTLWHLYVLERCELSITERRKCAGSRRSLVALRLHMVIFLTGAR